MGRYHAIEYAHKIELASPHGGVSDSSDHLVPPNSGFMRMRITLDFANSSSGFQLKAMLYSVLKMTIQTKSMMRRRVNRAGPSGLV